MSRKNGTVKNLAQNAACQIKKRQSRIRAATQSRLIQNCDTSSAKLHVSLSTLARLDLNVLRL